ncbi:hypothetical protein ABEB36_000420 [Hypothenemus hampei]|uniref:Uncharacterized protein n=1 Tax=Hypothenemus hampei TaxID=57062 RepID=A0ABD1FB57_HYPHA
MTEIRSLDQSNTSTVKSIDTPNYTANLKSYALSSGLMTKPGTIQLINDAVTMEKITLPTIREGLSIRQSPEFQKPVPQLTNRKLDILTNSTQRNKETICFFRGKFQPFCNKPHLMRKPLN